MSKDDPAWYHFEAATRVAEVLRAHDFEAYFIGGAVRDILLGRLPKDFDVVTNARPEELVKLSEFQKSTFKDTSQAFGVTRVVLPIGRQGHMSEVEVATYRRDIEAHLGRKLTKVEFTHLEDDVERRDITINALALDPDTHQLIDYVDGLSDLAAKVVRFIGEPSERIQEDPLRILRAIRFKNQLEFSYEPQTETALRRAIADGKLTSIAADRQRDELTRLLVHSTRRQALEDLEALGAMEWLLPEIQVMRGVKQPEAWHSEGDVYTHTLIALERLPEHISPRLAWATLLHDVGKPPTIALPEETGDRIRFNHHSGVGATMAHAILARFNFSKKLIDDIQWMIHYHLTVGDLLNMRPGRQHFFMSHDAFGDLIELYKADASATWNKQADGSINRGFVAATELEGAWAKFQNQKDHKQPSLKDIGIDGNWLKENYKLEGKELGKALEKLNDAYLDGEITTRQEAQRLLPPQD